MNKLLTVVIPTYKIEQYIEDCLNSFALEEVGDLLEVLVVNDGSPDHSAELAGNFEKKYPHIFKVIDKENGGHGSTINTGLKLATGKYFKVVDGDDWVDKTAFLNLLEVLKNVSSDIVYSNYCWVNCNTGEKTPEKPPFPDVEYGKEYAFSDIAEKTYIKMHSLTYRTDLLRSFHFKIDEHCFYVDSEYALFPIPKVETVYFLDDYVYMYRMGMEGQSMNIKNMQKNEDQFVRVIWRMLAHYTEYQKLDAPEANLIYMENAIALLCVSYFKILLSYPRSRQVKTRMLTFEKSIRTRYPEVYSRMKHPAVRLLRASKYLLYPLEQLAFQFTQR